MVEEKGDWIQGESDVSAESCLRLRDLFEFIESMHDAKLRREEGLFCAHISIFNL